MTQTQTLEEFINQRFGGVLRHGTHAANGKACALEALNAYHGRYWTDDPEMTRIWDIRPLNDARWRSDEERTAHLLPLLSAYDGCLDWPPERQRAVLERIIVETVRQIVSGLPGLSAEVRKRCHECVDLASAYSGAQDACAEASTKTYSSSYIVANYAARAATASISSNATSANDAARAASYTVRADRYGLDTLLVTACDIWLAAARE